MVGHSHHSGCGPVSEPSLGVLTDRLRRGARRVTAPRQAILDFLRRSPHPLSPKDIHAGLPAGDCDLVTVYRSLAVLQELGMVERFDFGDGTARFELVREEGAAHHHHLICRGCARVVELDGCLLEEIEQRIARGNGFQAVSHRLEFFGFCPACQ